ncbi:hypothetical protein [Streptomyces sp. 6N223]|uniref:hypothetical protein n=1 Tax=Streptomyces sp. 6N223 TaxID=3457412 RepID=UPI003FD09CFC
MRIQRRGATILGALALGVLPLTFASQAQAAEPHTVSLTVGPVVLPGVPIEVCIDTTCTPTSPLLDVTATAEVTTEATTGLTLTPASCPDGSLGVAIRASSGTAADATVELTVTGTALDGERKELTVGPENIGVDAPGVVISVCTES